MARIVSSWRSPLDQGPSPAWQKSYQDQEKCDEQSHSTLDIVTRDEEGGPADNDEERAGQVVGDHVVRHPASQDHLEARHAVVTCKKSKIFIGGWQSTPLSVE